MFAVHEVTVGVGFDLAAPRLTQLMDRDTLRNASEAAYEGGLQAVVRVGPFGGTRGLSKLVRVRFLEPVHREAVMTVPLRWEATGMTGELFPVLDADLTLTADGGGQSRLALAGTYRPPFGRAGAALDRTVMHHLATATIRSLLDNVATVLAEQPGQGQS